MSPLPELNGRRASPITAPRDFSLSDAFIAWPNVAEVVRGSPISMEAHSASTLQYALPISANGRL